MKKILLAFAGLSLVLATTGCEQKKPKEKTLIIDTSKEKCSAGKCAQGKCAGAQKEAPKNLTP